MYDFVTRMCVINLYCKCDPGRVKVIGARLINEKDNIMYSSVSKFAIVCTLRKYILKIHTFNSEQIKNRFNAAILHITACGDMADAERVYFVE